MRQLVLALAPSVLLALPPSDARGVEPLCDWLDGLGRAAQERADGNPQQAQVAARRALEARPAAEAAARARLELALALAVPESAGERAASLRAALEIATPVTRGALLAALGEALLAHGELDAAEGALRAAAAEGSAAVAARSRQRVAEALHAAGRAREAVAAWRLVLSDPLAGNLEPPARLAYGMDLKASGDVRRASEVLRAIWAGHPERPEAEAAERALSTWWNEGVPVPPLSADERIGRAFRLTALGRPADAIEELARADRSEPAPSPEVMALSRATALLALGRPRDAEAEVAPLERSRDPGVRRGAQWIRARAAAREKRFADAIAAWRAVAASRAAIPGIPTATLASLREEAEYFAAWLLLDSGDLQRASRELDRVARVHPLSHRAEDARWFSAWALIRLGDTARAEAQLKPLDDGASAPRVRYWRARITPDEALSVALLREVVALEPLGYYGQLACARLRAKGMACDPPPLGDGEGVPALDPQPEAPRLRQAAALAALGLRDEAVAELDAVVGADGGRRVAPLAAELAAFLGDPLLPFRITRDQLGLSRRTLAWSYPEAWPSIVGPAARSAGIDPSLVRAVMRRESGFRREARSAAGAVGLLQIVPGTAGRLTSLLGLPAPFAERLEEPVVNVPLGAGYLALLLERFREPLLAIAAYNAGPAAVSRWIGGDGKVPLDEWVESIPYRETRQYVRAVVGNWAATRAAAGEPAPPLDPDRPVAPPASGVAF